MISVSAQVALLALFSFIQSPTVLAAEKTTWGLVDTYIGPTFLTGFQHQAIDDPTHGRVQYVNQKTAMSLNLTYTTADTLILKSDSTTVLDPNGPGRKSVRIMSNKQYSNHVEILDVRHMPQGCGTWPAYWTTSATVPWPNAGEIDILEGVNDVSPNRATLHTTQGCTMTAAKMKQTGSLVGSDCYWQANSNSGCGVASDKANNYGPSLNAVGGGWYAMERTDKHISVWFWPRNDGSVPNDVKTGKASVDTSNWGIPSANFVNDSCNISSKFGPNNIIINLTFCGDWAGNAYPGSCPKTCVRHVNEDPADFADAYWNIASLRVYERVPVRNISPLHKRDHHRRHGSLH